MKKIFNWRKPRSVFICQVAKDSLKLLKMTVGSDGKREFSGAYEEEIPARSSDAFMREKITEVLRKQGLKKEAIILGLPGFHLTSRAVKVPARHPGEIERMASLQASHYLPYAIEDLVSGYEVMDTDKEGYSLLNLIIVPKNIIDRYFGWFGDFKAGALTLALYPRGLAQLSYFMNPVGEGSVLIIDIEPMHAELVIASGKKFFYSRYVELDRSQPLWKDLLSGQIVKTSQAYQKEMPAQTIKKIILSGPPQAVREVREALSLQEVFQVEVADYITGVNISDQARGLLQSSKGSFAGLVGLGLEDTPEALNFLPSGMKELRKKNSLRKTYLKMIVPVLAAVIFTAWGVVRSIENKMHRLEKINAELSRISPEARVLESIDERAGFLARGGRRELLGLDAFYQIYKTAPSEVTLTHFIFDKQSGIALKGQTNELNTVFGYASSLERSDFFKKFKVKIGYATKRKTASGEIVDFEILCQKIKAVKKSYD